MDIRKRKFLFYSFIVAFLVISFLTLAYAHGYRLSFAWPPYPNQIFQKTGMLLVKTDPRGAQVLLDGKNPEALWKKMVSGQELDPVKTPAKIKNINPGNYDLKLELEGYHDWQREIEVHPGKITSLIDINLIKNEIPLKIAGVKIDQTTLSPSRNYALDQAGNAIIDITSEKTLSIPTTTDFSSSKWSPEEERVILGNKIFSLEQEKVVSEILAPEEGLISNIKWGENSREIYYWDQNNLIKKNIDTSETEEVTTIKGDITDYLIKGNYIYAMSEQNTNSQLNVYSAFQNEIIKTIEFPLSSGYRIHNTPDSSVLAVYDKDYETLYIISPLAPVAPLRETVNEVKFFQWHGKKQMVYGNNFEIWNLDLTHHNKDLITRRSKKIKGVIYHPETHKIIYYTSDRINIIEETSSNKIKITKLAELPIVSGVFLGPEQKNIYFNSTIGHHEGSYKLNIY